MKKTDICNFANYETFHDSQPPKNPLRRQSSFASLTQRKVLIKCRLTWMFCGRRGNFGINHLHERPLLIVYKNKDISFKELFKRDIRERSLSM